MSETSKIIVVGTGGLAREFHAWFGDVFDVIGFSADRVDDHVASLLPGKRYDNSVTPDQAGTDQCVVAVSSPKMKRYLYTLLGNAGWKFPICIHATAVVAASAQLAEGVVVSPRAVIGSHAAIGALTYLNFQVGVGHDAVLSRFVQMNPGAQVGGAAEVGDGVLLGSNSALLQGVKVGADATVGLGGICLGRVRAGETMVGNPAKPWRLS